MKWKLKRKTNDELRQQFVYQTVPQAELIGLTIPDKDLKWNDKTNHYDFGKIDWDEFWQVIKKGTVLVIKLESLPEKQPGTMENGFVTEQWLMQKNIQYEL